MAPAIRSADVPVRIQQKAPFTTCNQVRPLSNRFCNLGTCALIVTLLMTLILAGCTAVQSVPSGVGDGESLLELQVFPSTAEIYIDDDYQGVVEGWRDQIMPIKSGQRRLELRADGYISQRFDLDVEEGQHLTLRARLESTIDLSAPDEQTPEPQRDPLQAPEHPGVPDSRSR